jgi:hypothetical protein
MTKLLTTAACLCFLAAGSLSAEETTPAPKHWTVSGNASLQFTQGYVSKNWYKGGESNMALLGSGQLDANYKKDRLAWDNKVEAKLGFVTTRSDQYHNYMTNNDLLKWTTKLGWEATKHWYYTLQGTGQTQFCTGFSANDPDEKSKFFAPAYANLALGMDYKLETAKFKMTAFISPFAYNLKFVGDPRRGFEYDVDGTTILSYRGRIDGTQFGLRAGEFNTYDFGTSAKLNTVWNVCKYLKWESAATYFSPQYNMGKDNAKGYTEIQWENTFDMPLNKFFSTKIYTCLRFDDSVGLDNKGTGWGYFQFSELLSFGISYNW